VTKAAKAAAAGLRFDELVQTYYHAWFRFHPEAAVDAGVPGYAHLLTPCSEDAKGGLIYLNDELRVALEELNPFVLDEDRRVDYELLWGAVQLENQLLLDLAPRRVDPHRWLPVNALYQLTIRPVENLEQALASRLGFIPQHLQDAEADLSSKAEAVPPGWVRSATLAAHRGAEFTRGLTHYPIIGALAGAAKLAEPISRAAEALQRFGDFLEREVAPRARGDFACGPDYFQRLLRLRHFLDVHPDRLHAFGERLFEDTRAQLESACAECFGHRDYLRAVREIQSRHPSAEALLGVYKERVAAAREFIRARGLVTVPERERLEVIETPVFLRHEIPFAAYSEPAPNDPDQVGRYYVTPPIDAAQLAEHDDVGIAHTCVHEGYPGHHLQFVTANLHPAARSLPRLLNASASLYEGWALYTEQLMHEQGFLDRPESRMVLLRDRLWRALRVMLDVELHTRGLTLDAAADRMVKVLGFPRSQADADLAWYTRSPAVPLGYATGWAVISALRRHVVGKKADALLSFHDRLLSAGSIAVRMVIRRAFGEKTWDAVKDDVFGERS
jgi:hypothetical protein